MRSRYAAFALGLVDYVLVTTDPNGPMARADRREWTLEVEDFCAETGFLGLAVLGSGQEGDAGWVRFRATLTQSGQDASFTERSTFVRRDGRWLYVAGTTG